MPFVILDVLQTQCKCSAGHLQKEYFVPKVWELEESSDHNNYGEDDVCHLENVAHPEYCASVQDICRLSSTPGFLHSLRSGDL